MIALWCFSQDFGGASSSLYTNLSCFSFQFKTLHSFEDDSNVNQHILNIICSFGAFANTIVHVHTEIFLYIYLVRVPMRTCYHAITKDSKCVFTQRLKGGGKVNVNMNCLFLTYQTNAAKAIEKLVPAIGSLTITCSNLHMFVHNCQYCMIHDKEVHRYVSLRWIEDSICIKCIDPIRITYLIIHRHVQYNFNPYISDRVGFGSPRFKEN